MAADPMVYFEIGTPSGSRARTFYGGLFGWVFREMGKDPQGVRFGLRQLPRR